MRWRVAAGFAVAVVCLGSDPVRGQAPPPGYSPYLNLARPGNAGINYYGLVRPQIEFRADVQQLQRNTTMLQSGVNQLSGNDLATGHPVGYMYFGGYYPSLGRGRVPARTLPGAPAPPARPQSSAVTAPAPYRR